MLIRQRQAHYLQNDLTRLRAVLNDCHEKYRSEKNSEIFQPTYHVQDRIPFFGNEHQLSFFFKLLVEGGFVLAADTDINTLKHNVLGDEFVGSLKSNKKSSFKKHLILKKDLAKRVADYFYCVDPQTTMSDIGFEVILPKQEGVSSRMNTSAKSRIGSADLERFERGFTKILKELV